MLEFMGMEKEPPRKPAWRRWLKRIALGLLVVIVLLAVFHRPIIFGAARYFAGKAAKEQNLDLQFDLGGSIFSSLTVSHVKATPTRPGMIEKLEVGEVHASYSLPGLVRHGLAGLLDEIDLRNVTVVINPSAEPPKPKPPEKGGKTSIPPLWPKKLNIENVNFVSHAAIGDTELKGLDFKLDPDKPGVLKLDTLNIPGMRRWDNISAQATFKDQNLILTNLNAGPEIQLKRVGLDGSKLEQNEAGLSLEGSLLGSSTLLEARVTHLDSTKNLTARARISALNFDEVWRYLNLTQPLHGTLTNIDLDFQGPLDKPVDWEGKIQAGLDGLLFDQQRIGNVAASVNLHAGKAAVTLTNQIDPQSKVALNADVALPQKMEGFSKAKMSGTLDLTTSDLAKLLKPQGVAAQGDLATHTPFIWENGTLKADVGIKASRVAMQSMEFKGVAFQIHVEKTPRPGEKNPLERAVTQVSGLVANARFQDYAADNVKLALASKEMKVTLDEVSLSKGANFLKLQGHGEVPADFKSWSQMPLDLTMHLNAPELQTFVAEGSPMRLAGTLRVDGQASAQKGHYSGDFQIAARDLQSDQLKLQNIEGNLKIADDKLHIAKLDAVFDEKNKLTVGGDVGLTPPFAYAASVDAALTDLSSFQPLLKNPDHETALGGSLTLNWKGSGEVQTTKHSGDATLALTNARYDGHDNLEAHLAAKYSPEVVDITNLQAMGEQGEASLNVHWDKQTLQIRDIAVSQKKTPLLTGSVELPLDIEALKAPAQLLRDDLPVKVTLQSSEIDLEKLQKNLGQVDPPVDGFVQFELTANGALKDLAAKLSLHAVKLRATAARGASPAEVLLNADLQNKRLKLDGSIKQESIKSIDLTGEVPVDTAQYKNPAQMLPMDQPLKFSLQSGEIDLKKLLSQVGQKQPAVGGTAKIQVTADGPLQNLISQVSLQAKNLRAQATPNASPADVALNLHLQDKRLKIAGEVKQDLVKSIELTGDLPVDTSQLKSPSALVPADQPLKLSVQTGEVDLRKLMAQLGQKNPPVTGNAEVHITAEGMLKNLAANVSLRASKLLSPTAKGLAPADVALNLDLEDKRLKVNGTVKQAQIQPLEITGDVPVDLEALQRTKSLNPATPLHAEVRMPSSSLTFVPSLAPAIRYIKGTAAIDVKVGGTVASPDFSGSITSDISAMRLASAGLAPLNNVTTRIGFTKNQVTIQNLKGGIAGGTFGATGTVKFEKITEPIFDLRLVSNKALVVQDDNITARVSADIKATGPLNAGTLSGSVFVTKSHFFKDIDILPIGLPGRPAPQPKPPVDPKVVSFPNPPLRDWKFDIAIKTADDFLIQGNLADGKVTSDVHLGGTGLAPWLEGSARIKHLTTSLPFSTLEIANGNIFFTQDAPFLPKLSIRGTSVIRDYTVTVDIYGTAYAPEAIFSSEPPLPQSDIVALLATGTTTKELTNDPNALAGRAAFLVVQKYYRKWFKKDKSAKPDNSLLGGAKFDVGGIDPKTGKQALEAKLPMSDHFTLSGGVDVGGDFRGQIKYVLRFR